MELHDQKIKLGVGSPALAALRRFLAALCFLRLEMDEAGDTKLNDLHHNNVAILRQAWFSQTDQA